MLRSSVFSALVALATLGAVGQAMAFDDKVFDDKTGVKPQSSPWAVFHRTPRSSRSFSGRSGAIVSGLRA